VKLFARHRWPRVEGRVIDKRRIRKFLARFESSIATVLVDEYLVEFPGPDGEPARLAIKAKSVHLPIGGVSIGQTVPLHVNRRGTQAVFGSFETGPSRSELRRLAKEQRARDEARFKAKLERD
jgi:hypothetical protein